MFILASQSPRRHELLGALGIDFVVRAPDCDERCEDSDPARHALTVARRKLEAARLLCGEGDTVLAADTVVAFEGRIFGKPRDRQDAVRMLRTLSGGTHTVCTGLALYHAGRVRTHDESTRVTFRTLPQALIEHYVRSGEAMDKAGAYGVQRGAAVTFVERLDGDYYNVMGLPLCALATILEEEGLLRW